MPATVIDDPLGITCTFSNGTTQVAYLGPCSNVVLARQLLVALADLVHPHGRLDSARTIETYLTAVRDLLSRLGRAGFRGSAEDLTRARVAELWMGARHQTESLGRILLRRLDDLHDMLRPDVRELVDGRLYNPNFRSNRRSLQPYTETEWSRLIETCRSMIRTSFAGYRDARAMAERAADPRTSGWSADSVQWLLLHRGPDAGRVLGTRERRCGHRPDAVPPELYPGGIVEAVADLFPPTEVVKAYQVLFGAYTGIVPDGLGALGLGGIEWAGDVTVLLDYVKGRTAAEGLTLSVAASRLLRQWLEHSSVTRAHAPEPLREELWVRFLPTGQLRWAAGPVEPGSRWVRRQGLLDDAGAPLRLHGHRIRTTFESLRDRRGWRGSSRATIDPNHSPQVEGDHYLQVSTPAQKNAVDAIIEDAQNDMVRRAQPPVVLDAEEAARFAERYPDTVERLHLDHAVIAELLAGERDVFTAACADQLSGLHGPTGKPCPARPWVCLLCPLALFAPRHLPNLLRLKAFFARQWKQMPAAHFMAVFGPYATRLDHILSPSHFPAEALAQAADQVADTDDELPLRAEETTV
ncbi:hypothetical protein [Amycolatopsis anabasis]|uniref:hypothetical protein n=1 Tax=Amycolatopsis anabasis TaxID=1840409 RepID=UPI00131AE798|nr:hypothetical protein [Amycolatopsis anabasis]